MGYLKVLYEVTATLSRYCDRRCTLSSPSSRPSNFVSVVATNETVQLPTCVSTHTNADEVPFQPYVPPTVCNPSSSNPHYVDHTYSNSSGTQKVTLMSSSGQAVGMGSIADGNMLHGKVIPDGYTKVIVEYIQPGTVPMLTTNFDDEELCAGQFAAWATACIIYDS